VQQQWRPALPGVERRLELDVPRIEAAHETERNQWRSTRADRVELGPHHVQALGNRWRQRFLAEHRLTCPDRGDRQRGVGGIVRGDHHRVHLGINDQRESVGRGAHSGNCLGRPLRPGEIDIGDNTDRCPGDLPVQGVDVVGTHDPGADDAHANVHLILAFRGSLSG
jgi:hypothetical protein